MVLLHSDITKNDIHPAQSQPQEVGMVEFREEMEDWASALFEMVEEVTPLKITLPTKRLKSQKSLAGLSCDHRPVDMDSKQHSWL